MLDLRGGGSDTSVGDVGNAYDISSKGVYGDVRGPQAYNKSASAVRLPEQLEMSVANPLYPYSPETRNALYFYQDTKPGDATQASRTAMHFANAAVRGDTVENHFCASLHNNSGATNMVFGLFVPAGTAATYGWKFKTALESSDAGAGSAHLHLSANGTPLGEMRTSRREATGLSKYPPERWTTA